MVLDPAVLPLAWATGGVEGEDASGEGDGCFWCVGWVARLKSRREGRPFVSPKVSGYGLLFSFAGGSLLGPEIIQPTISPLTISLKSSIPLPPSGLGMKTVRIFSDRIRNRIRLEGLRSVRIRVRISNIRYRIRIQILKSHIYDIDVQSYAIRHG